jgi:hypothetical protein
MSDITYYLNIEAGPLGEVPVVLQYDYQPAERRSYTSPGCCAEVDIYAISLGEGFTAPQEVLDRMLEACRAEWVIDILEDQDAEAEERRCEAAERRLSCAE